MNLTDSRKLRVLVADDHPLNLRLVVLMDVTMPVLDGVSALHAIRRRETGAVRTPVIMLTGHDSADDRTRLLGEGADGYLAKPIEVAALKAELHRLKLT